MPNQLWQVAQECCRLLPGEPGVEPLGRVVPLTGAAAQTITSLSALGFGGLSEQAYAQKWMWRPQAATAAGADNIRYSDSFTPSTGVVTHSGTAYTDTTATSESCILTPFYPGSWRDAINLAVTKTREMDFSEIPVRKGLEKYSIFDLDWIEQPSWIRNVWWTSSPILVRNRFLQKYHTANSSGSLAVPDFFTLTGASATVARSTTTRWRDRWTSVLTRAGTDCRLGQSFSTLFRTGVLNDGVEGESVVAWAVVNCGTASRSRVRLYEEGSAVASSSFHSGDSTWDELSTTYTDVSTDFLTSMEVAVTVETGDVPATIGEIGLAYGTAMDDAIRRGNYEKHPVAKTAYSFEQGGPLQIDLPQMGNRSQFIIESERPFPAFDATRLLSGAADTDETDAPLTTVATGTIFYLFRGKYGSDHALTREWEKKFENLRTSHIAAHTDGPGFDLMRSPIAAPALRSR